MEISRSTPPPGPFGGGGGQGVPPPSLANDSVGNDEFKYACIGYGVYKAAMQSLREEHGQTSGPQGSTDPHPHRDGQELPWCQGLEVCLIHQARGARPHPALFGEF